MAQEIPLHQNETRVRMKEVASSLLDLQVSTETLSSLQYIPEEIQARFYSISLLRFEGVPMGPTSTYHWTPEAIMYWNDLLLSSPTLKRNTSQRLLGFCCRGCRLASYTYGMNGSSKPPFTFWVVVPPKEEHGTQFPKKMTLAIWHCIFHLNSCLPRCAPIDVSSMNENNNHFLVFLSHYSEAIIDAFHQHSIPMSLDIQRLRHPYSEHQSKHQQEKQEIAPAPDAAFTDIVDTPRLSSVKRPSDEVGDNLGQPATRTGTKHKLGTTTPTLGEDSAEKTRHQKLQRVKIEEEEYHLPPTTDAPESLVTTPEEVTSPCASTTTCETTAGDVSENPEDNMVASTTSPREVSPSNVEPDMRADPLREPVVCAQTAVPETLEQYPPSVLWDKDSGKGSVLADTTHEESGESPQVVFAIVCEQNSPHFDRESTHIDSERASQVDTVTCNMRDVGELDCTDKTKQHCDNPESDSPDSCQFQPKQPDASICPKFVDPQRIVWGSDQHSATSGNKWYHSLILRVRGGHRKLSSEDQRYSLNELLDYIVSECKMTMVRWKDNSSDDQELFAPLTREEQQRVVRHSLSQRFPDFLVKPFHTDALLEE